MALLKPSDYIPKLVPILVKEIRQATGPIEIEIHQPIFDRPDPSPNIARGKPATQSSICETSRNPTLRDDAGGAVNGLVTGTFGFHTGFDDPPWWMVDLEARYRLSEIWVFNRLDAPTTLQHFRIYLSIDGREWTQLVDHVSNGKFGGAWGKPLTITPGNQPTARFFRFELGGPGVLHLDQVKIFGSLAA
jgi:hypothetical protein